MTIVPVRSLTTTLAGGRTLIERFCICEINSGTDDVPELPMFTLIWRLSMTVEIVLPNWRLITFEISRAEVKSASRSTNETVLRRLRSTAVSRSTVPPFGIRATVGWLNCLLLPELPAGIHPA